MKRISINEIKVASFGKLENYALSPEKTLTALTEDNGWGKSTLAAFIKAMFYGLPVTKAQSLEVNERRRYTPWSGRVFGGSLSFSVNGREYRIERTFDPKNSKNDVFRLIDLAAGRESGDYGQNIGLSLFGVEAGVFARSILITEQSLDIPDQDAVKSITAKLSGLTDEPEDIGRYDTAMKKLDERRRFYDATGKRGAVEALKNDIANDEARLSELTASESELKARESEAGRLEAEISGLEKESFDIQEKLEELSRAAYKARVHEICVKHKEELERLENEKKEVLRFFASGVPDDEKLSSIASDIDEQRSLQRERSDSDREILIRECALKEYFANYLPELGEITEAKSALSAAAAAQASAYASDGEKEEIKELEREFKNASDRLKDHEGIAAAERELDRYPVAFAGLSALGEKRKRAELEAEAKKNPENDSASGRVGKNKVVLIPATLGILLMIAGIILLFFNTIAGVAFLLFGALILLFAFILKVKSDLERKAEENVKTTAVSLPLTREEREREEELRKITSEFFALYPFAAGKENSEAVGCVREKLRRLDALYESRKSDRLKKEARAKELENAKARARELIGKLGNEPSDLNKQLNELEEKRREYDQIIPLAGKIRTAQERDSGRLAEVSVRIERFLALYPEVYVFAAPSEPSSGLEIIKDRLAELKSVEDSIKKRSKDLEELLKSSPDADRPVGCSAEQTEEETEKLRDLRRNTVETLAMKRAELTKIRNACALLADRVDGIPELFAAIEQKKEKLSGFERRLLVIRTAMSALSRAKENISLRYLGKIRQAFAKYCSKISPELLAGCEIDIDLAVSSSENGVSRQSGFYSRGTRDMMGICLALALSDALFEDCSPFVILDDPFVNLDKKNLDRMKELLTAISEEKQMLYFTCHESRGLGKTPGREPG